MKYTFTRKQIVNAFNNKILNDDNFLTYLLSTTSKDIPMNQKSLDTMDKVKEKKIDLLCRLGFHKWEYSLSEAMSRDKNFKISLSSNDNVPKEIIKCSRCGKKYL